MRIAYIRVSTEEQNEARQKEKLSEYNIEKWFIEKVSGKNIEREQLQQMIDYIREGDVIYVHDFSRFARNLKDLLDLIELLDKKNVKLISTKENFDTSTPTGKLMIQMIGAINEFERNIILERQREGIAIAKRNGKYKGRKKISVSQDDWDKYYKEYMEKKINKVQFAKALGISRPVLYRFLKDGPNIK